MRIDPPWSCANWKESAAGKPHRGSASPKAVEGVPEGAEITGAAWSPDGNRIAWGCGSSQDQDREDFRWLKSRLVVCDPDGRNATTLLSIKGERLQAVQWQ